MVCTTHLQAGYGEGKEMGLRMQEVAQISKGLQNIVSKGIERHGGCPLTSQ